MMKIRLNHSFAFIVLIFMLSCINRQPINNEQEITITVSPDEAVENIKASELYADIHYIPLETRDDCLIGEVWIS